jgi:hypothetical protein
MDAKVSANIRLSTSGFSTQTAGEQQYPQVKQQPEFPIKRKQPTALERFRLPEGVVGKGRPAIGSGGLSLKY